MLLKPLDDLLTKPLRYLLCKKVVEALRVGLVAHGLNKFLPRIVITWVRSNDKTNAKPLGFKRNLFQHGFQTGPLIFWDMQQRICTS